MFQRFKSFQNHGNLKNEEDLKYMVPNTSAHNDTLRILIFDIFQQPFRRLLKIVRKKDLAIFDQVMKEILTETLNKNQIHKELKYVMSSSFHTMVKKKKV